MAQEQPSSLPHWRTRQHNVGSDITIREAAAEVDRLLDLLGRKQDAMLTALCIAGFWGFALGVLVGWWRWA